MNQRSQVLSRWARSSFIFNFESDKWKWEWKWKWKWWIKGVKSFQAEQDLPCTSTQNNFELGNITTQKLITNSKNGQKWLTACSLQGYLGNNGKAPWPTALPICWLLHQKVILPGKYCQRLFFCPHWEYIIFRTSPESQASSSLFEVLPTGRICRQSPRTQQPPRPTPLHTQSHLHIRLPPRTVIKVIVISQRWYWCCSDVDLMMYQYSLRIDFLWKKNKFGGNTQITGDKLGCYYNYCLL